MKRGRANTLSGMSTRCTDCPASARLAAGFGTALQRRVAVERDFIGEFPVTRLHVAGPGDRAVADIERGRRDAEPIGCGGKEDLPDLGAGLADGASGLLDRKASRGHAFVRACRGRGADHLHAADIDIEFVGGDLRQRRDDALSDLDLAGRQRQLSLGGEFDP